MKQKMTAAIALACLSLAGAPATAQEAERGAEYYLQHCATCHGLDAMGNGPMAGVLLVQPTDLTRLSAGNDGVFPIIRVVMRIDGRDPLVSHGSPMPVYGQFFQQGPDVALKAPSGQPILTSEPISDLVAYLQSLQGDL
ncbi:c-type cytochrome [Aestuariivita boseongensis]|uniref:c-type cytochrome n=1 Tax=Aestuariivita boseongensis TaxID=1470562 RepID=UPI000B0D5FA4|nr:cytochrome c [Aestuariivita boseongensis]